MLNILLQNTPDAVGSAMASIKPTNCKWNIYSIIFVIYSVMYEHNRYRGKDRGQSGLLILVHQDFPFTRNI